MSRSPRTVTKLLHAIEQGDENAGGELFTLLYEELRSRARRLAHRQPKQLTLQATALVHEAYVRLVGEPGGEFKDRDHFLACASKAMRHVLVDHARRPHPISGEEMPLDALVAAFEDRAFDMDKLDLALRELEQLDPEMVRAVELRFFGGASEEDAARILELPLRTLQRRWKTTRAWLRKRCDDA